MAAAFARAPARVVCALHFVIASLPSPSHRSTPGPRFASSRALRRATLVGALLLAATGLAWPAAGQAAIITFGSSLAAPATQAEAHGADAAFWPIAMAGGQTFQAPASGQILTIRFKGIALANPGKPPLTQVHFQALRPQSNGSVQVITTTGPFNVPASGDPNQVSTFQPVNFCVAQGDYVDFNDEGGFDPTYYPNGVPFQIFGKVPGSVTDFFTQNAGTLNGATFSAQPPGGGTLRDEELLLQVDLGTGTDATPLCPGGGSSGSPPTGSSGSTPPSMSAPAGGGFTSNFGTNAPSVLVPSQTDKVSRSTGAVSVSLLCHSPSPCMGGGSLYSGSTIVTPPASPSGSPLATANFMIPAGQTGMVPMQITNTTILKKLRKKRKHVSAALYTLATSGSTQSSDAGVIVLKGGP
ncbi:MAG TPA: hypothetical protein VGY97_04950 [Solirubrobacteraceae bacterium]|nr:hypothetical protein [Solirubrobacteraceae bacterium]